MGGYHVGAAKSVGLGVIEIDTILDQTPDEVDELLGHASFAVIASPTPTHVEWAYRTIAKRIPTLIEKPVASTLEDARRIKTAADFAKVPVAVGYLNRFNPAWLAFREQVSGPGRFWAVREGRPVGREYGGVGLDLATHDLDLIYNLWPDAIIHNTVNAVTVSTFEVSVPSANIQGRVTARYGQQKNHPNIREWSWVSDEGQFLYFDMTRQSIVVGKENQVLAEQNQVVEQLFAFIDYSLGRKSNVATIEDGIRVMEAQRG